MLNTPSPRGEAEFSIARIKEMSLEIPEQSLRDGWRIIAFNARWSAKDSDLDLVMEVFEQCKDASRVPHG